MKLLQIRLISDYKMLRAGTTIDFIPKSRSVNPDDSSSLISLAGHLYYPVEQIFVGANSSGKTTILECISKVLRFLRAGRLPRLGFPYGATFAFNATVFERNEIYSYEVSLDSLLGKENLLISKEALSHSLANEKLRKNLSNVRFKPVEGFAENRGLDTSAISSYFLPEQDFTLEDYKGDYRKSFLETYAHLTNAFGTKTLAALVQLFDDSVESITLLEDEPIGDAPRFEFIRKGCPSIRVTGDYLCSILSAGTIRGITLFGRALCAFVSGGYLIVDEIENSFHKNLVDNLRVMFAEPSLNKAQASLIFSTHYAQLLDFGERSDNIEIVLRDSSLVQIKNLAKDFHMRSDAVRSLWFDQNAFGTLTNYDRLRVLKESLWG